MRYIIGEFKSHFLRKLLSLNLILTSRQKGTNDKAQEDSKDFSRIYRIPIWKEPPLSSNQPSSFDF